MKWCDFSCEYASTDRTDNTAGACRREMVMFCERFGQFVKKNEMCIEIKRRMRDQDPEYQRLFGKSPSSTAR